ncbi:MAG TPA: hypothetical protein VNI20_09115, partial [Fimbriimonadaceae bacterium]|nr:hypothetical protein [Fimbriimonadaceae bacterium]
TNGIPHVGVDFFDSIGTLVGSARTMPDGTFSGHVPTSAALMMLQGGSIRTSLYYVDVYWQGIHYSPLDATCRIAIGPLTAGDNPLPATPGIPLKTGGPPPPPSGCS